uniref:Putative secreted protein n=1 Tax=Amblyomma triste TaxID=251400 RepID=A0A023G2W9_AMBTT
MATKTFLVVAFVTILRTSSASEAPCLTVTLPDFLTTNRTKCTDAQPTDICVPFNENETQTVRDLLNCTSYDLEYKVIYLTAVMQDAVAATLPIERRNDSWIETETIVRMCSYGVRLPKSRYNLTCDEYLSLVEVTCEEPTTIIVPDVNGMGEVKNKQTHTFFLVFSFLVFMK